MNDPTKNWPEKMYLGTIYWNSENPVKKPRYFGAQNTIVLPEGFDSVEYIRADLVNTIINAAKNLVAVKGRHHSEIAYNKLVEAVNAKDKT